MKIYAITKGHYSDYHICALTLNEKRAKILKEAYSDRWGKARIEEYEDEKNSEFNLLYSCGIHGDVEVVDWLEKGEEQEKIQVDVWGEICCVYVRAKDKEHARKKAYDMIAEYKAKKAGIC